ncbi:MAG: (d)CMP kinase [Deltaproteobacteria bacterium]|nr:(d)CMP kinase [Deltaproteobacteria bacterium]
MKRLLITIDGPGGAGKTTVSRKVAQRLGYTYVDTGALYRAVALAVLRGRCSAEDDDKLVKVCKCLAFEFKDTARGFVLFMNGVDISGEIRTQQITMLASALSARPVVRQYLLDVQRRMAKDGGVVFEGRDMGTVVFPEADVKLFLYADHDARALRRYKELVANDQMVSLEEVSETIKRRDYDDSNRVLAPLKPARDAIRIDSTFLGIEEVVDLVFRHIGDSL